jgi:hypothetical protein
MGLVVCFLRESAAGLTVPIADVQDLLRRYTTHTRRQSTRG